MSTKSHDGALAYLDDQIEALKTHVPAALEGFDATGIHQARVATRRLKAGLDLLQTLLKPDDTDTIAKAGKQLRRRLGPLRDLDVMIDHLHDHQPAPKLAPTVHWIAHQFQQVRREAREEDRRKGKPVQKLLSQFDDWWRLRHRLRESASAIAPLLTDALHSRFDRFSEEADWVCGISEPPEDKLPVDVHALRIDGKALRYTFEIADAHGIRVPKPIFRSFKAMQEALGTWHDYVVLAEQTMRRSVDVQLGHHDPEAAALALDLSKQFLRQSARSLNQFKTRWQRSGEMIRSVLHEHAPLTRDVSREVGMASESPVPVSAPQTDRDRPEQAATPRPEAPVPIDPGGETR